MTEWAGSSDMYVLIRSDCRYYLGIYYALRIPCFTVEMETPRDARVALCWYVLRLFTLIGELPDKFRGKGRPLVGRKSLIDDGRRRFRWGSR